MRGRGARGGRGCVLTFSTPTRSLQTINNAFPRGQVSSFPEISPMANRSICLLPWGGRDLTPPIGELTNLDQSEEQRRQEVRQQVRTVALSKLAAIRANGRRRSLPLSLPSSAMRVLSTLLSSLSALSRYDKATAARLRQFGFPSTTSTKDARAHTRYYHTCL